MTDSNKPEPGWYWWRASKTYDWRAVCVIMCGDARDAECNGRHFEGAKDARTPCGHPPINGNGELGPRIPSPEVLEAMEKVIIDSRSVVDAYNWGARGGSHKTRLRESLAELDRALAKEREGQ